MAEATDITVHVETPTGAQVAGTIPAFDIQPADDQKKGNLGGIPVKFAWRYGKVVSVQVASTAEADLLIKHFERK
jgi:hypothetical protein